MTQKKTYPWIRAKYVLALLIAAHCVIACSKTKVPDDVLYIVDCKKVENIDSLDIYSNSVNIVNDKHSIVKSGIKDARLLIIINKTVEDNVCDEPVSEDVNQWPEYPGGLQELVTFLSQNLVYPKELAETCIHGRVYLSIIVEKDGSISNIEEFRSPHHVLTEEAIRVVKMMPKWKPAMKDGEAVRVKMLLPISFSLNYKLKN